MDNYADVMFTPAVAEEQRKNGTFDRYAQMYPKRRLDELGPQETEFLTTRTSIYIASVSETGWPYVQHRGGPRGFLKVLDGRTLGFADYRGNQQYITKGNLTGEDRVSIFAVDYPRKARLKLQGHASMVDVGENDDLARVLNTPGAGRVERCVTIRIVAMDWNCPQFITPRFDTDEIAQLVGPEMSRMEARIAALEAENAQLKAG